MPNRRLTTRIPARDAGSVAASHSRQTSGRKPLPGALSSVSDLSAPVSVESDSGGAYEDLGRARQPSQRLAQAPRALHAASPDLRLASRCPAPRGDVLPGQVDDRIHSVEAGQIGHAARGIPGDLVGADGRPADQPGYSMIARREEGDQGRPDEASRSGDGDMHGPVPLTSSVRLDVRLGDGVAIREHPIELFMDASSSHDTPEPSQWQSVFDVILELAGGRPLRLEAVSVPPVSERPLGLPVAELATGDDVVVNGDPAKPDRSGGNPQDDPRARLDAARPALHRDPFPGRGEPLQGAGPGVPGKDLLCRGVDPDTPTIAKPGHGLRPPMGSSRPGWIPAAPRRPGWPDPG